MKKTRIILGDDHLLLAEAIRNLLEVEYEVVGIFSDPEQLIEQAFSMEPDVAILDVHMPKKNGLTVARHLKNILPKIKIILLTVDERLETVSDGFRNGASGYVLKTSAASELMVAIREVLRGGYYASPRLTEDLVGSSARSFKKMRVNNELTARQKEVLQLLGEGYSMKQIANALNITPRTVAFHKYSMMEQLEITSTAQLISYALQNGFAGGSQ